MDDDIKEHLRIMENSPLIFKIKKVSSQIFDVWKNVMKERYPHFLFKAEKSILEQDLLISFSEALKSLIEDKEENEDQNLPGWEEGYIYGFVSSNVAGHWVHEYIYTEDKEYKELMYIKALIIYLQFDKIITYRIERLHKYLIEGKIEPSPQAESHSKIVDLKEFKNKLKKTPTKDFYNLFFDYLEAILIEKHLLAFDKTSRQNYLPNLKDFFSFDEIKNIIDFHKKRYNKKRALSCYRTKTS